jgi:hypothetical protein
MSDFSLFFVVSYLFSRCNVGIFVYNERLLLFLDERKKQFTLLCCELAAMCHLPCRLDKFWTIYYFNVSFSENAAFPLQKKRWDRKTKR